MTAQTKMTIVLAGAISAFLIIAAFLLGRMTASEYHLRSACDLEPAQRKGLQASWYLPPDSGFDPRGY